MKKLLTMPLFKVMGVNHRSKTLLLSASLLVLAACATTAPVVDVPGADSMARAAAAENQQDWLLAAENWESAASLNSDRSSEFWLQAADAWWKGYQPELSRQALLRVQTQSLGRDGKSLESLLNGELALVAGDLQQAEFFLSAANNLSSADQRTRLRLAKAELDRQLSDPFANTIADAGTIAEAMMPGDALGILRVLQQLETVPTERLQAEMAAGTAIAPWASLQLSVRETLIRNEDLLAAATRWSEQNPQHPVDTATYMEVCWQYGQQLSPPLRVAVLLPDQGSLSTAASAIRDGISAAFFDQANQSEVAFIPVGETPESAVNAYQQAVNAGYQWVIGPLRRASVTAIARLDHAPVPALLLNWPEPQAERSGEQPSTLAVTDLNSVEFTDPSESDDTQNSGLSAQIAHQAPPPYGLSLSQEAEARAVARKMLSDDQRQVIMLLTDNSWGQRIESAFIDEYLAGEGRIVALERFSPDQPDHSEKLTRLLQIEDSRERKRRLQSALNMRLEFEDSRRDDFSAIFMAANPVLGRQLKPQLRFFDAGSKPVYAMGRAFSGNADPRLDTDLNGVIVPTTVWGVESTNTGIDSLSSLRNGAYGDLYALGRDAWGLLPWLPRMKNDPGFGYPGQVGTLHVDEQGLVQREPVWVQFSRGRPVLLTQP